MKERPILVSAPMVRAILEGRKTQTRRIMKPQPVRDGNWHCLPKYSAGSDTAFREGAPYFGDCPYGKAYEGDRLWVRETCRAEELEYAGWEDGVRYLADNHWRAIENTREAADAWIELNSYRGLKGAVVPSIHMPRWASRITLEITGVRVERLQDISEKDAKAEGVEPLDAERDDRDFAICPQCGGTRLYDTLGANLGVIPDCDCLECDTYAKRYRHLWESINGPGSWDANPWVWVIEFKKVKP